eukprot:3841245-Pyramimonas_sp.AAC.1
MALPANLAVCQQGRAGPRNGARADVIWRAVGRGPTRCAFPETPAGVTSDWIARSTCRAAAAAASERRSSGAKTEVDASWAIASCGTGLW